MEELQLVNPSPGAICYTPSTLGSQPLAPDLIQDLSVPTVTALPFHCLQNDISLHVV